MHAKCYGELEPLDGVLWLCNLCRPGAPKFPPRCCLCPVIGILICIFTLQFLDILDTLILQAVIVLGGAIKPTTDGRWAHLTCAMWIPGS